MSVSLSPATMVSPMPVTAAGVEAPSAERISLLANLIGAEVGHTISKIRAINTQSKLLSINAQIEAIRASGTSGDAFGVVAQAIQTMSGHTAEVAERMSSQAAKHVKQLQDCTHQWAMHVQGGRASDLALTNIDLIDRNLYERSCDVRWWATDSSLVQALTERSEESANFASKRMGVILDAYTVYLDLVLCDLEGKVIANGRPQNFHSRARSVENQTWFVSAMQTHTGNEYGFEGMHSSNLVNQRRILGYSCSVREEGGVQRAPIGVLGILFNWDSLAETIVSNCPLDPQQKAVSQVWIADDEGRVLASAGPELQDTCLGRTERLELQESNKNYRILDTCRGRMIVAHAVSPGFETYRTGWHSWILTPLPEKQRQARLN